MSAPTRANAVERITSQMGDIDAVDDREAASISSTIAFLRSVADPFDETVNDTHVTASAFVVSRRGVILHQHRLLGRWFQPGGHVDAGESPEDAAVREVREETGLVAVALGGGAVFHVDVHPGPRGHVHHDLRYVVVAPPDDPAPAPGESDQVAWFSFPDAVERAEAELTPALLKLSRVVASVPRETLGA